mmetsp:Transcript_36603/g.59323  ORF Transcript_36603/g.59323 Transcript_36603/m.59323 type:complete len:312 (+) Transcript_36603:172-1107(+)
MIFTRYEYANLFHQMTDWYNMYVVGQREKVLGAKITFLFLDGHAKGALDTAWTHWSRINDDEKKEEGKKMNHRHHHQEGFIRVKHLNSQGTCFHHALLMPMGYRSPVDIHGMTGSAKRCRNDGQVNDFRMMITKKWLSIPYNDDDDHNNDVSSSIKIKVGMIFRRDYLAHPRAGAGRTTRKISNEMQVVNVLSRLKDDSNNKWSIEFRSMSLESMPFKKQVEVVSRQNILIGVHGAALSHVLWMKPGSDLIEITSGGYSGRFHFEFFATWAGLRYRKVQVQGGNLINVNTDVLAGIVRDIANAHYTSSSPS